MTDTCSHVTSYVIYLTSSRECSWVLLLCLCFITFFSMFCIFKGIFSLDFSLHCCIPPLDVCNCFTLFVGNGHYNGQWHIIVRSFFSRSTDEKGRTFDVKLNKRLMLYAAGRPHSAEAIALRLTVEVCRNDFLVPIPFPLPSNHSHSHSHPFPFPYIDYLKAEKYVYCVVNLKQNMKLQQKHC